jgi:manganese transport protein
MRRLITRLVAVVPAILVISAFGENEVDSLLIFSQVILSLQLGFAVIPLIHFVSDKKTMGAFAIKPFIQFLAWVVASILVYLNLKMLTEEAMGFFADSDNTMMKVLIAAGGLGFVVLLFCSIVLPLIAKHKRAASIQIHPETPPVIEDLTIPSYKKIAVALDFSDNDTKLIASAMGQATKDSEIVLIHIVETATSILLGKETDDHETRKDEERLNQYVMELKQKGMESVGVLGFRHRSKEIVRIVKEQKADMLILGAHGHTAFKDFVYGETINAVRHDLKIAILVVNL